LLVLYIGVTYGCSEVEYECPGSGACIPRAQQCDGVPHCPRGEDEDNCKFECTGDQFKCHAHAQCVDSVFVCDGHYDCHDKSDEDEYFCKEIPRQPHTCSQGHFMCGEGTCIPDEMLCDGVEDCVNGEDEADLKCKDVSRQQVMVQVAGHGMVVTESDHDCPAPNIRCNDTARTCIPRRHFCDGEQDCLDGSDEVGCGIAMMEHKCQASQGMFSCAPATQYATSIMCLAASSVCDGRPHCPKGDDEGDFCKQKKCETYGCEQNCMEVSSGASCYCQPGYTLSADGKSCEDIDECQHFGVCSQTCTNTKGGYECGCLEGYMLQGNASCRYIGTAELLIAMDDPFGRGEIRSLDLHRGTYLAAVKDVATPVGVAYDYASRRLVWTDASAGGRALVESAVLAGHGEVRHRARLLETGLELPEDLAIYQAASLVYFTDSHKGHVAVCLVAAGEDGHCAIVSRDHQQPRGLAVHQARRLLYLTEWGAAPRILQMNLDGSGRRDLITRDVKWPNGIAVDEPLGRLYWSDAELNTIESAKLDGSDRRIIVEDVHHPFGVAVFEDKLYWSDWHEYTVFSCNKFTGNNVHAVMVGHARINGLSLQFSLPNPAALEGTACISATCSHLCIPTSAASYTCKCPDDMALDFDDATCLVDDDASDRLILAVGNSLVGVRPQHLGLARSEQVGFENSRVTGLQSGGAFNGDLLAHTNHSQVVHLNTRLKSSILISSSSNGQQQHIRSLAYDADSLNLFWVDGTARTVNMMSQQTKRVRTLARGQDPRALLFQAVSNHVVYIDGTALLETSLDGRHTRVLAGQLPDGASLLAYDETARLFYVAGNTSIVAVQVGGTEARLMPLIDECESVPTSLAVLAGYLYWTEQGVSSIMWTSIASHEVDHTVYKLEISNPDQNDLYISSMTTRRSYGKPCLYYGCSDLCIRLDEDSARCLCGDGRKLVSVGFNCEADGSVSTDSESQHGSSNESYATMIGMIVCLCVLLLALTVGCLCCLNKLAPFKPADILNRSRGMSPSMDKPQDPVQMSNVELPNGMHEVENPGYCTVQLEVPAPQTPREEPKENLFSKLVKRINSVGTPKMSAMEWNDVSVGYENLVNGSSTPSTRRSDRVERMDTIRERDSAYSDLSNSMEEDTQSTRNLIL